MSNNLVISIDAMGGDNSPRVVIEGLALASKKNPDARFLVFGDSSRVNEILKEYPALSKVCEVRHSPEVVRNEDKPSAVIRNRNTSMFMAINAVKQGEAQAVVSAGNTGALMAISKLTLKTIQKIHRPAIVSIMPHRTGRYVMLDLGANAECDEHNIAQFAVMGSIYSKILLGKQKPKVGILNIGSEDGKGLDYLTKAEEIFEAKKEHLPFEYFPHTASEVQLCMIHFSSFLYLSDAVE